MPAAAAPAPARARARLLTYLDSLPSQCSSLPSLVVFDLDDTLWWPELYMLDGPPFSKDPQGVVRDRRGEQIYLHEGARVVLDALHSHPKLANVKIAIASRTEYEAWAHTCLELLDVDPAAAVSAANVIPDKRLWQIFPSNKRRHFDRIQQALAGMPYEDMIFYDNERGNCTEVSKLGVTCVYTPNGLTVDYFLTGLEQHARRKQNT